MKNIYKLQITQKLSKSGKKPVTFKELLSTCRKIKKFDFSEFTKTVEKMKQNGEIFEDNSGIRIMQKKELIRCEITRVNKTFGFAKRLDTDEEIFIPGKYLKGAMPTDVVGVHLIKGRGESPEGEVLSVFEEHFVRFTGDIVKEFGMYKIMPDTLSKNAMEITNPMGLEIFEGDKVMAEIIKRGERHSEHRCMITSNFGSSLKASVCALSVLDINGVTPVFPAEVIAEARAVSDMRSISREAKNRLDLRDIPIFTIDGADTKDIDDAVSVSATEDGYEVGVHIADVSYYVTPKSKLDEEAFHRGTSVYYANRVIPMLPQELSNGICSLNPQEDRLAFSCLMKLDKQARVISYKFAKSIIRSRVKGVYSEINELLAGYNSKALVEKYAEVIEFLPIIKEVAGKLCKAKKERGAPSLESVESKLIISPDDICVDVMARTRGESEEIIEDFMLLANECAAKFGQENNLPFVYRIHETPSAEKLMALKESLTLLNIPFPTKDAWAAGDYSDILEKTKDTSVSLMINNMVLRSMAKARYSSEPVGHFGLVLDDYAHFTSPIRRYPDLSIHRIMSDFLNGLNSNGCHKKYDKFVLSSSESSSNAEVRAMTIERSCEDCYKAEFMKAKVGEVFDGIVVSATSFGLFIGLPNTCEGLLHTDNMPQGEYVFDGGMSLRNINTGVRYSVGDKIRVKLTNANVSTGKCDFQIAE